ncbi:hypothetical protein [Brevibacillus parabrevis]|uniref:hypothetical protein n=1 Tax=Brevibacillus parabrevis TaxID=54914 RepID=UPI0028D63A5A|nr:hypothetical protein [Brevibacillus parabrevis]MED1724342.1 hypothetical protein [Brevibacillus parabrevis]
MSEQTFRQKLAEAGVVLHGADYVYYFPEEAKNGLLREKPEGVVRQLTELDEAIFAQFQSAASEQDLDDAYVELDHWAVFGSFEQSGLVCAASMYPWENAQIADLGVLTLASYRGKGHARVAKRKTDSVAKGRDDFTMKSFLFSFDQPIPHNVRFTNWQDYPNRVAN